MKIDFFIFFRFILTTIAGIYATIVTLQGLYGWYAFLQGPDRYVSMMRRYLMVHGLRVRLKTFWGDVLMCILLSVVLLIIWHAHHVISQTRLSIDVGRTNQPR